jgi:hypothetical protein
MLLEIAADMQTAQFSAEQQAKSEGHGRNRRPSEDSPAETHGLARIADSFTLNEVVGEIRALRASVVRLWTRDGTPDREGARRHSRARSFEPRRHDVRGGVAEKECTPAGVISRALAREGNCCAASIIAPRSGCPRQYLAALALPSGRQHQGAFPLQRGPCCVRALALRAPCSRPNRYGAAMSVHCTHEGN